MSGSKRAPLIPEFFAGRHVLVTGGTGFMGKVLVEKLLRSCPQVGRIYLLLRPKRGRDVQERVKDILDSPLFSSLAQKHPGLAERAIVGVSGDIGLAGLGLSAGDRQQLLDHVSVVFHGAATVRFDEPIQSAILINVRGTRDLGELAAGMKGLVVFVHISTTYCNTDRTEIGEKVYPAHADWKKMIDAVEKLDPNYLNIITKKLLHHLPNTYCFSKSLGEHCIYSYRDRIPVVVFRPSIVISSLSEPVAGWMDNFHGPVALMVACGKGLVHLSLTREDLTADYMPVDLAIKAVIVAAWERATARPHRLRGEVPVYNCSSAVVKPVSIIQMIEMNRAIAASDVPLNDVLWPHLGLTTDSRNVLLLGTLLLHMLPALLLDAALLLQGKPTRFCKLQRRIYVTQDALSPFLLKSWRFHNANILALDTKILPDDRAAFSFDFHDVDEFSYFRNVILGSRRYLLNEPDEDLPKARAHYRRMEMVDKFVRGLLIVLALLWAYSLELYLIPVNIARFLLSI